MFDLVRSLDAKLHSNQYKTMSQNNQNEITDASTSSQCEQGYTHAINMMHECLTEHGFLATPTEQDNYRRIWSRDSAIIGLAAVLSEHSDLIEGSRRSLETLARYQGPHGEIPSNVDPTTDRVSYGGTTGRVDADLWFVIGCGAYWRATGDDEFLKSMIEPLEKVRFLLGCWEFNTRGLLYIPPTGDWADEYLQSGYVLYDQLLYLQAQRELCAIHRQLHQTSDHDLEDRVARLKHLISDNYWFNHDNELPDDLYHEVLYENGRKAAPQRGGAYWMPFFSPFGYGYRFDAMANAMVMLLEVANEQQCAAVDDYIAEKIVQKDVMLLPAFDPVITPRDEQWDDLQTMFSHTFKNGPFEYHNGGLWPMVTGFYAASLAKRGKFELAKKYRDGIHAANRMRSQDRDWSFPEYLHGQDHTPGGTSPMGWSAAAAVIATKTIEGKQLFCVSRVTRNQNEA